MSLMKQPQLGLKILELRQQKGFTQEELVEQCNVNTRTIQRIEAGEVMPRVYTVKTILAALDRDLDDLQESVFEKKVKKAFFQMGVILKERSIVAGDIPCSRRLYLDYVCAVISQQFGAEHAGAASQVEDAVRR